MFEDQHSFAVQRIAAKLATPKIDAQLEGHIHPRILASRACLAPAQIMDGKFRASDKVNDALKATLRTIGIFWRKSRMETKLRDAECNSLQKRRIIVIERAV